MSRVQVLKTFATGPRAHDQRTKFTAVRFCRWCLRPVMHHQHVDYDRQTGFKTYVWEPTNHRCTRENRT